MASYLHPGAKETSMVAF